MLLNQTTAWPLLRPGQLKWLQREEHRSRNWLRSSSLNQVSAKRRGKKRYTFTLFKIPRWLLLWNGTTQIRWTELSWNLCIRFVHVKVQPTNVYLSMFIKKQQQQSVPPLDLFIQEFSFDIWFSNPQRDYCCTGLQPCRFMAKRQK